MKYIPISVFGILLTALLLGPITSVSSQSYVQRRRAQALDCDLPEETRLEALYWMAELFLMQRFYYKGSCMLYTQLYRDAAESSLSHIRAGSF